MKPDTNMLFSDLHVADIWGMRIPIVSRRSLLQAKKETNRPKDRIDYEELTAMTKEYSSDGALPSASS